MMKGITLQGTKPPSFDLFDVEDCPFRKIVTALSWVCVLQNRLGVAFEVEELKFFDHERDGCFFIVESANAWRQGFL